MEQSKSVEGADYSLKVIPANNKTWREAEKMEVSFILNTATEKKTFKGIIDLYGIMKRGD